MSSLGQKVPGRRPGRPASAHQPGALSAAAGQL